MNIRKIVYIAVAKLLPVQKNSWLFSSFYGEYADSPRALSELLHKRDPHAHITWIAKDPSIFPAEFFINCLDNEIAIQKFTRMRIYELYNVIKDLQYSLIRWGISIPNELKDFTYNDQSALLLKDINKFNSVIKILNNYNINTEKFTCSINKYLTMDPKFGYDKYFITRYNYILAKYLKSINYKIV